MINTLKRIKKNRGDSALNIQAGMKLIQAKIIGEDMGLISKTKFAGELKKLSPGDRALLITERDQLEQEGYGAGALPGHALKKKILRSMLRVKKQKTKKQKGGKRSIAKDKNNGASYSKDLGENYRLKPYVLAGGGMKGKGIEQIIKQKIVPGIVKSIGLKPSVASVINRIVPKLLKLSGNSMSKIISNLSKGILPLLVQHHFAGKGIRMSGRGIMKSMKGKGLEASLATSMLKALKWWINSNAKAKGLPPTFKGKGMYGNGFWGDFAKGFKKGFKSVFVPGAKLLGTAATAFGQPEFGIPLSIAGSLVDKI